MKQKILSSVLILTVLLFVAACPTDQNQEFYIASNGSSSNKGTKESPFSSPDDAKNAIRQLKKENRLTKGDVIVWLREGIYELPVSFSLLKDDSGTENGTITYSAYPGEKVVLSGGRRISFTSVNPVSPETAKRFANKEATPRILEEIDYPGEYYIDNQKGMLYFYPFEELKSSDTIMVSMLEDALVSMKEASYIQFKNITFEAGRGIGIYMENTSSDKIENCAIRNMGGAGVCIGMGSKPSQVYRHPDEANPFYPDEKLSGAIGSLYELFYENTTFNREGGKNNGVISCKIENTGRGGVSLGGGDRLTLEPAGNYVFNCEFTNCARLDYSYKSPVNIDGVGNKIQHCQFNSCPATSIYVHGNNHLIEYNVISEACNFMDDQGAIYIGRDPSEFGNIIRYNFFKNIGKFGMTMAVYYDDGACGTQLYGNVFYKAGSRTIMVGGGSYNSIFNNIFINSDLVFHLDNRLDGWASNSLSPGGIFEIRMNKVNYDEPPYSVAYPALATYFKDSPQIPKHNDIKNNLYVNIKELHNGQKEWGPIHDENIIINEDPGFEDAANLNFTLAKESEIFKTLPEFLPIPFKQIGLIKTN